jgi:lipopolysaccharide biosynthesis glycosyltransferase
MEPIVIALASNEPYFLGLYCAVASALTHLNPARKLDVKVLDGGLSQSSRDTLSRLTDRIGGNVRLEFVTADASVFAAATLGPGQSHMTYCRMLLPHLVNAPRLIYLDCDTLVFRDLSELFDLKLSPGKVLAAVRDSETLSLAQDSLVLAKTMNLPAKDVYFNCGVMLMNLDELRRQHFFESAVDFLNRWNGIYRFWDQSAINFLLHRQIEDLPEHWNRASWRFDAQETNDLDCVLHYTTSAPWLRRRSRPAQILFERFAAEAGLPVSRRSSSFQGLWQDAIAPLRALAFPAAALCYRLLGKNDRSAAYQKVARYWLDYVRNAPRRRRLYRQRNEEISRMRFDVRASLVS